MSDYKANYEWTLDFLEKVKAAYSSPVLMFSGGKDSLVMLHIARQVFSNIPVLFHREPWFTEKYAFAEKIIRDWGMTAFDYPPAHVALWEGRGIVAWTNYYQVGMAGSQTQCLALPKNIIEPAPDDDPSSFLCGAADILGRPTGYFNYPWNIALIGHKNCDEDQIAGKVPLKVDIAKNHQGPHFGFPMRHWSNREIWSYIHEHGIPYQTDRYKEDREIDDKTANSDYFRVCIACIDRRRTGSVFCPKHNIELQNAGHKVPYDSRLPEYIEKT